MEQTQTVRNRLQLLLQTETTLNYKKIAPLTYQKLRAGAQTVAHETRHATHFNLQKKDPSSSLEIYQIDVNCHVVNDPLERQNSSRRLSKPQNRTDPTLKRKKCNEANRQVWKLS